MATGKGYIREKRPPHPTRQKMVNLADRIHCRQDYHLMPGAVSWR